MSSYRPRVVNVPFLDLWRIHERFAATLGEEFSSLIERGSFVNGAEVAAFEDAFAAYCGAEHCVGLSSGLDALRLALIAAGLGRGSEPGGQEVIVPAHTFIATVEAVTQAGARPVLVDVREDDFNLDAELAAAAVTEQTAAILPVHLYGQLVDVEAVGDLARRHGLTVIEDACQAHGATRAGVRAGTLGDAAAFSFYPGKNLGAMGDAGAVVCDDPELARSMRALREHGQREKYHHVVPGYTARIDTLQAIVLQRKLPYLDEWNEQRRTIAAAYSRDLDGVGDLMLPASAEGSEPVWHLYVVRTGNPVGLAEHLAARGISTGRHYPEPIHLSAAYRSLGYGRGDFPVTERIAASVLSLPIFPGMTGEEVETVVEGVKEYFDR
jgi:dTDP-3-amino-3,4,6-trideoxy-alpha-D-glucose transaminase